MTDISSAMLLSCSSLKTIEIPKGINPEMGLIRSSVSSYKRDPTHPDLINGLAKAEMSLNNIQATLITLAEEHEDEEYVDARGTLFELVELIDLYGNKIFS